MFSSRTNWHLEPNRFSQALENHRRSGRPLLDLTASNPTICGFSYPQPEIVAALCDRRALEYVPESKGLLPARQGIADYYGGRKSFSSAAQRVDPERILLTSGTSEAYSHIFRLLCEPGDEVLVPAPSYPLFEFLANLADVRLVSYPLVYDRGWQADIAALRAALTPRSRAVLVVHPNNPTGSFVSEGEARELAAICSEREMALVADEVFLDYAGDSRSPATFAMQESALTFTLSGLSKVCALPQMKLAWMVVSGPPALVSGAVERLEIIADTYLSPSTPVQWAVPTFLALGGALRTQLQQRIAANLACLDGLLGASGQVTRLRREGGWYAVLCVPASVHDDEIAVALLERSDVLVHPGHFFDFDRDGFLVLSLITGESEFQEGARRLLQFFSC